MCIALAGVSSQKQLKRLTDLQEGRFKQGQVAARTPLATTPAADPSGGCYSVRALELFRSARRQHSARFLFGLRPFSLQLWQGGGRGYFFGGKRSGRVAVKAVVGEGVEEVDVWEEATFWLLTDAFLEANNLPKTLPVNYALYVRRCTTHLFIKMIKKGWRLWFIFLTSLLVSSLVAWILTLAPSAPLPPKVVVDDDDDNTTSFSSSVSSVSSFFFGSDPSPAPSPSSSTSEFDDDDDSYADILVHSPSDNEPFLYMFLVFGVILVLINALIFLSHDGALFNIFMAAYTRKLSPDLTDLLSSSRDPLLPPSPSVVVTRGDFVAAGARSAADSHDNHAAKEGPDKHRQESLAWKTDPYRRSFLFGRPDLGLRCFQCCLLYFGLYVTLCFMVFFFVAKWYYCISFLVFFICGVVVGGGGTSIPRYAAIRYIGGSLTRPEIMEDVLADAWASWEKGVRRYDDRAGTRHNIERMYRMIVEAEGSRDSHIEGEGDEDDEDESSHSDYATR